jgi:hypothetical protein
MGDTWEERQKRIAQDIANVRMRGPNASTHTIEGQMYANEVRTARTPPPSAPPVSIPSFPPSPTKYAPPPARDSRVRDYGPAAGPRRTASGSQSGWFPTVDRLFDSLPRTVYIVMFVAGALFGLGYADDRAAVDEVWFYALVGAGFGVLVLPALRIAIKLTLAALVRGAVVSALYVLYGMLAQ